ncbi:MAG: hypothetical protein HC911_12605 [Chloroflexaceae bacterium]|nr:hypothetical protein [Chloroflexaceae bacterium]
MQRLSRTRRSIATLQRSLPRISDPDVRAAMRAEAQGVLAQVQALLAELEGDAQ